MQTFKLHTLCGEIFSDKSFLSLFQMSFGGCSVRRFEIGMQQRPLFKNEEPKTNRHTPVRDVFKEDPGLKFIFFLLVWA